MACRPRRSLRRGPHFNVEHAHVLQGFVALGVGLDLRSSSRTSGKSQWVGRGSSARIGGAAARFSGGTRPAVRHRHRRTGTHATAIGCAVVCSSGDEGGACSDDTASVGWHACKLAPARQPAAPARQPCPRAAGALHCTHGNNPPPPPRPFSTAAATRRPAPPTFSIATTTSIPLTTRPNTVCLPSSPAAEGGGGGGSTCIVRCAAVRPGSHSSSSRAQCSVREWWHHTGAAAGAGATSAAQRPCRPPGGSAGAHASPLLLRVQLAALPARHSQGVGTVVMKNCDPFVPGPALAMERVKGRSCRRFLGGGGGGGGTKGGACQFDGVEGRREGWEDERRGSQRQHELVRQGGKGAGDGSSSSLAAAPHTHPPPPLPPRPSHHHPLTHPPHPPTHLRISSGNSPPQIDSPPVPLPAFAGGGAGQGRVEPGESGLPVRAGRAEPPASGLCFRQAR